MKRHIVRRILLVLALVLLIAVVAFVVWAGTPAGELMDEAVASLQGSVSVSVSTEPWLTFTPATAPKAGFIFYPGGRVLPEAYAPALLAIASDGYLVIAPAMPLNLAVFAPDKAASIIAAHPEIKSWVIGGHSLGGSMAATYAHSNPSLIDGLVLWASYPQASDSLADSQIAVVSIYATRDGLLSVEEVDASRQFLPSGSAFIPIEGGNHAQFGYYGPQAGDNDPVVSRDLQQQAAVKSTLALLDSLSQ